METLLDRNPAELWDVGGLFSPQGVEKQKRDPSYIGNFLKGANPDTRDKVVYIMLLMEALDNNTEIIKHVYCSKGIQTIRQLAAFDIRHVMQVFSFHHDTLPKYCLRVESDIFNFDPSAFLSAVKNIPTLDRFEGKIRTGISKFITNQPSFDIRNTSVVTAASSPGAVAGIDALSVQAVIDGLCEMQRTLAFASTLTEFRVLMHCNLTSAFKIASMTVDSLIKMLNSHSIAMNHARAIHERATNISNRNQSVLTSLHQAVRGTGMTAIDGHESPEDRLRILGEIGGNSVKNINLEELFGAMDSDPCDDCNSVTSPAAYFVELLQFLRNNNLNSTTHRDKDVRDVAESDTRVTEPDNAVADDNGRNLDGSVLQCLFARRPDLGNLQLTCPNTTAILPYIDLANEVMESFVVHLANHTTNNEKNILQAKLDVYNSSGTTGEMLSEPQVFHPRYPPYTPILPSEPPL